MQGTGRFHGKTFEKLNMYFTHVLRGPVLLPAVPRDTPWQQLIARWSAAKIKD